MPITREDSYIVQGTVRTINFDKQTVRVIASGLDLGDVPVSSQYMSINSKRGFHAFPRVGDSCWLVRDVDKWFIVGFGSKSDGGGNRFTPKTARYAAETIHVSSDVNTVDLLAAKKGAGGLTPFAEQKYGLSTETLGAVAHTCGIPNSFTALSDAPDFSVSAVQLRKLGCGLCSTDLNPIEDIITDIPRAVTATVAAILVNNIPSPPDATKQLKIRLEGGRAFFAEGIYAAEDSSNPNNIIPEKPGVKLNISGIPTTRYVLNSVPTETSDLEVVFTITQSDSVLGNLTEGVYDVELENTKTGACFKVFAVFSIHLFSAGSVKKTYFSTPSNMSIGFDGSTALSAPFTTNPPSVGVMFTVRSEIASAVLQMQDINNVSTSTIKYVGIAGAFPDFLAVYNEDGTTKIGSASSLNALGTCHETLATLRGGGLVFKATVTGIGVTAAEIKSRLEGSAASIRIFSTDDVKENMGVRLNNFMSTDRFRIEIYRDITKTAPNYSGISLLYSMSPTIIGEPVEILIIINGENIRYGSNYFLRQATQLVNRGLSNEAYEDIIGAAAYIPLGSDSDVDPTDIEFTDSEGAPLTPLLKLAGTSKTYRVHDELVGLRLNITTFEGLLPKEVSGIPSADIPYGDYDLLVSHPDQSGFSVLSKGLRITYSGINNTTGASNATGEVTTSTKGNVVLQKVNTLNTDTKEEATVFTYAVDEAGRCDIVTSSGFYINGKLVGGNASDTDIAGTVGKVKSDITFSSEEGDGELITSDGNITIAAFKKVPTATDKGDVRIHADSCLNAGQDSPTVFVGRRSLKSQYSTMSKEAHFGGIAKAMSKKFPAFYKTINAASESTKVQAERTLNAVVSIGPVLIPDEKQLFVTQQRVAVTPPRNETSPATINTSTFSETFFSMRSRVTTPEGYLLEGRINLIFVPDGLGKGTDEDPFTGTWQIPLV